MYAREHGKGRVVYFPFDVDRTFWEILANDHGTLLKNAVAWTSRGEQPLSVTGKGLIDVSLWRQKSSMTAHLVNLTNPMAMKGPVREIIPSPPQHVRIRVPKGSQVKAVRFLVNQGVPRYRTVNGFLEVEVPPIELNEAVAVDLV